MAFPWTRDVTETSRNIPRELMEVQGIRSQKGCESSHAGRRGFAVLGVFVPLLLLCPFPLTLTRGTTQL